MAQTVVVNLKLDSDIYREMEQICSDFGLSVTEAFNMFAEKSVRGKRIPFEIPSDLICPEANM